MKDYCPTKLQFKNPQLLTHPTSPSIFIFHYYLHFALSTRPQLHAYFYQKSIEAPFKPASFLFPNSSQSHVTHGPFSPQCGNRSCRGSLAICGDTIQWLRNSMQELITFLGQLHLNTILSIKVVQSSP